MGLRYLIIAFVVTHRQELRVGRMALQWKKMPLFLHCLLRLFFRLAVSAWKSFSANRRRLSSDLTVGLTVTGALTVSDLQETEHCTEV